MQLPMQKTSNHPILRGLTRHYNKLYQIVSYNKKSILNNKGELPMIYSDYHLHTNFSSDSDTDMEKMILQAIKLGLKEIAITDHIDFDYPDPDFPFLFDYTDYAKKIQQYQQLYGDTIQIRIGVELGLQEHIKESVDEFCKKNTFDFVIGSTHCIKGLELYHNYFYKDKPQQKAYQEYFENVLENIQLFDCFQVYGHMDYVNRYGEYENRELNPSQYRDIIDEILTSLIHKEKGLEINTSGFKYGLGHPHPKLEILKRYRELGGEIITIGSDAHSPQWIASHFYDAYALLKEAGFKAFTVFEKQQPTWVDIPKNI
jgi:histidinol-phosphatase (PHP family)